MSRKDQIKYFCVACMSDDPFIVLLKRGGLSVRHWSYLRAIRLWRDRIKQYIEARMSSPAKEIRTVLRKSEYFFLHKVQEEDLTLVGYLNFLLYLAEGIIMDVRNKTEKHLWDKLVDNLAKLYVLYDPEYKEEKEMDFGTKIGDLVYEVF